MFVRSAMYARGSRSSGEMHFGKSLTIPDQVVPLADMLVRYANGVPLMGNSSEPMYYGDQTPPDPRSLDLNDIVEMRDELSRAVDDFRRSQADASRKPHQQEVSGSVSQDKPVSEAPHPDTHVDQDLPGIK